MGKKKYRFYAFILFLNWVMSNILYNSRILLKTALHKEIKKVANYTTFFCYGFSLL